MDKSILVNNKPFGEESKQIVCDQTVPIGKVRSGIIFFAYAFSVFTDLVLVSKELKTLSSQWLCEISLHNI